MPPRFYLKGLSKQKHLHTVAFLKYKIVIKLVNSTKTEHQLTKHPQLVRPNEPDQLSQNLDPRGPTRPNSIRIWTLWAQPDPKSGPNLDWVGPPVYRVEPEFEPYLRPTRPNWTRFWTLRDNLTQLNPNLRSKIEFDPKRRVGFGPQ